MKSKPPKFIPAKDYQDLVKRIQSELTELGIFITRRTAQSYWNIGKWIHEHVLEYRDRADYGRGIYAHLEKDIDRDKTTLRKMVQFYRAYPIGASWRQLSWSHYRALMLVKDQNEREKLEKQIIQKDWNVEKVQKYLNVKRELKDANDHDHAVSQLKYTRGALDCFEVVKDDGRENFGKLVADFGFRQTLPLSASAHYKEGDIVEFSRVGQRPAAVKTDVKKEEIYTYPAEVLKVVDGDTLLVRLGVAFGIAVRWKLRLRGIDCPEIDTPEGKAAKRFVENRLKDCAFIVVKTYKDRTDIFDRYLADIFYKTGISSQGQVASEGTYLNQELLDNRLAALYEP